MRLPFIVKNMAYKHNCGCGSKGPHVSDLSCLKVEAWEDVDLLLGVRKCGDITKVEKPEFELSAEDRTKLDTIQLNGADDEALFADGEYRKVYRKEDEEVVVYDSVCDIYARNDIVLNQDSSILYKSDASGGNRYSLLRSKVLNAPLLESTVVGSWATGIMLATNQRPAISIGRAEQPTEYIAYQSDVEQLRTDVDDIISEGIQPLTNRVTALENDLGELSGTVSGIDTRLTNAQTNIVQNRQSIIDLTASTEAGFNTVNDSLSALDDRITTNTTNIAQNTSDIEDLRDDLANQEKFRGYFDTTAEITALPNPTNGDYAWNVQTGTVWAYNGTTWYDTTVPIPDQSVDAYDGIPRMDGIGDAGTTNRYARGDHQHPSDDAKANVTALNDYLKLTGNTQTTRMTGPIWITSGQRIYLTNSGNSNIGQNSDTNTTEITGNGVGGINLISANGTVKANGGEVVVYDANNAIQAKSYIFLPNDRGLQGYGADGTSHNLIEKSRFGIIDAGSTRVPFNISSSIRPTVQLSGETGAESHEIAFVGDLDTINDDLQGQIDTLTVNVQTNTTGIANNRSDIDSILSSLADTEHFRGYKLTTAEVTSITNPVNGDYAYNIQTGTIWLYNGTTWTDSGDQIPDGAIQASTLTPLMDGIGDAGSANEYARGDHRHPTDTTRAPQSQVTTINNTLSQLIDDYNGYVTLNNSKVDVLETQIATNSGNISSLTTRVGTAESNISTLQTQATQIGIQVNDIASDLADTKGRVSVNELDIATLKQSVNDKEVFKGYFLTNAAITRLPGTQGDFAWSAESGTIWIYDESVPSWTDSGDPIPDSAIILSSNLPLVDGEADPGTSTEVSRSDHRHPTDPTKQDNLVSGTTIKTVNGETLLGSGDIEIEHGRVAMIQGVIDSNGSFDFGNRDIVQFFWKRTLLYPSEYTTSDGIITITDPDVNWEQGDDCVVYFNE